MKKILLAQEVSLPPIGGPGLGPFGEWWKIWGGGRAGAEKAMKTFTTIISNVIGVMTTAAGVWFMFQFIIAGWSWLTAGGNKEAVSAAQERMKNASIGLLLVVAALAIVGLFGKLLGLDILITKPGQLIDQLKPGG